MAGLTSTGLAIKTLEEIQADIESRLKANVGPAVDLQADSLMGNIVSIISSGQAEIWEVIQAVHSSQYPDSANGQSLDNVAQLTGATRLPSTKSFGPVTITGTPTTIIPVGRVISTPAGDRFATIAEVVIGGGGTVTANVEAEEFGAIIANAGTLTTIETPVAGWASVTNALDVEVGRETETDAQLRLRREQLLARAGDATVDAIRSDVLAVADVTEAFVFQNTTLITDADGVPGKSVEVVVEGGIDADIAQAIFGSISTGIESHGVESETVVDSQGFNHTIKFTRPTEVETEWNLVFEATSEASSDAVAQIKTTLATFVNNLTVGRDVYFLRAMNAVFNEIDGLVDVTTNDFGRLGDPPVVGNQLSIDPREIAKADTANMTVVVTIVAVT